MINQYGQPVGDRLPEWQPTPRPVGKTLSGRFCQLRACDPQRDFTPLFNAYQQQQDGRDWTYLMSERPENLTTMYEHLEKMQSNRELVNLTVVDSQSQMPVGTAAFMCIEETHGVLEIGHLNWSPLMKQRSCATEAIFLMSQYAFDELGYRRCEWKCDSLNEPSRQAALRFGFRYEGRFHKALVTKGRSRDTDWFAITDEMWPTIRTAFEQWLDGGNFTADGQQKQRLQEFMP